MKIVPTGQDVPIVDAQGRPTPIFFEKFKALCERDLRGLTDVDVSGLADGDVLIWDDTAKRFKPGAN